MYSLKPKYRMSITRTPACVHVLMVWARDILATHAFILKRFFMAKKEVG